MERLLEAEDISKYTVQLEVFNGPLDLLLHLIERRELDVTLVSLAAVTDQYIDYIQSLPEPDPDHLAEFLVIAAKLLAIKAAALIARPAQEMLEDEENGEDLVRMLREYQVFKGIAATLKSLQEEGHKCYARLVPAAPIRIPKLDGLSLSDLVSCLRSRLETLTPEPLSPSFPRKIFTIMEKIETIEKAIAGRDCLLFGDMVLRCASTLEVVVLFLALLEMIKSRRLTAHQSEVFGEIEIKLKLADDLGASRQDRLSVGSLVPLGAA